MKKHTLTMLCLLCIAFSFSQETKETQLLSVSKNETSIFNNVDSVPPIYPGCKGDDNETLRKCTSYNISKYILENFNFQKINVVNNLSNGLYRIDLQFKINSKGYATDILTRSKYTFLKQEAIRVVNSLPHFKPGTQSGKPGYQHYYKSIIFNVDNGVIYFETEEQKKARLRDENEYR